MRAGKVIYIDTNGNILDISHIRDCFKFEKHEEFEF